MKINVWFRNEQKARVWASGEEVHASGPGRRAVEHLIDFYGKQTGLMGEALVGFLAKRLQGHWWAEVVDG